MERVRFEHSSQILNRRQWNVERGDMWWARHQKAGCQSESIVSPTIVSLQQWPHNVRKCPTMSGGGIKQASHQTSVPAGLIHENGETFKQSSGNFHTFIGNSSNHLEIYNRLSKHWNGLMFHITGGKTFDQPRKELKTCEIFKKYIKYTKYGNEKHFKYSERSTEQCQIV